LKPTLCADVDSTIWDTGAWVSSAVLEIAGEVLDTDRITTWTHVLDTYGEKTTMAIFDRVFDPERVRDRQPYPHAPEVLRALQEKQDIGIHFVTHNDTEIMAPHLDPWLRTHFGPNVGLTVTTEDKLGILDALGAFGLIDDRPDTIERVADAGLWAAAMKQPWNRDLLSRRGDVHGFSHWREVPNLLPSNLKPDTCNL
jgi:5'(3')-deoxyribonucleotidase